MKKLLFAALLAGVAVPADAAVTIKFNLTAAQVHMHSESGGGYVYYDRPGEGWAQFVIGQPLSPTATQNVTISGDTLTIDWLALDPVTPTNYFEIKGVLKFDHDLGGILPVNPAGFLPADSSFYAFVLVPDGTSSLVEGAFTSLDSITVEDVPEVERQGDPSFSFTLIGSGGVPEPATWAMMIGGFALAGVAMRRRVRVAYT